MVVRIGGINRIDLSSLILNFVDIQGNILQTNILVDKLDSDDVRNATIIPPAVPFKMKLTGSHHMFFLLTKLKETSSKRVKKKLMPCI